MPPPAIHDDEAPPSAAPDTVDWERASRRSDAPRGPLVTIDTAADEAEKTALARDLSAIGSLDERPDRGIDRAVAQRTTLARARALRFRLALLQAWAGGPPPPADPSGRGRVLHLDLTIDAMLIASIADGAPAIFGPTSPLPVAGVMVEALRSLRPDLPRMALRDRAAASIARLTIVGWKGALDALARAAAAIPADARALALELAARAALVPAIDEHRLGALHDLEKALGLPTGSVAPAIEAARRALGGRARSVR